MTTSNMVFAGGAKNNKPEIHEALATVTHLPGQVLVESTEGSFALSGAAEAGRIYFAEIPILGDFTTAAVVGETCQAYSPASGEYYNLSLAASQTITKDSPLKTDANGDLVDQGGTGAIVAYADEAVTTTGAKGRIRVRIA